MNTETLIGSGRTGRVYRIDGNPGAEVRKHFSPVYSARLWNWFFYESPHPLSTEAGWEYAYWKRRLAHRLGEYIGNGVDIVDAITPSYRGFVSPFIDGHQPKRSEMQTIYPLAAKMESFFDDIGMPTWSFSRRNPFSASNFIINGDGTHIVDYEQSVPLPDIRGNMGYDEIYFDDVHGFVDENRTAMINRLGTDRMLDLEEALAMTKERHSQLDFKPRFISRFDKISRVLK